MKLSKYWVWMTITAIFLMGLAIAPLRYPSTIIEANDDSDQIVKLDSTHPVQQTVVLNKNYFSGVIFWANNQQNIQASTKVKVEINSDNPPIHKEITKSFNSAFNVSDRSLYFTFFPIFDANGKVFNVNISLIDTTGKDTLRLRKTQADANVAIETLTIQPMAQILFGTLLRTNTEGEDIYYYWQRGSMIASGGNPYICALDDTCINHKNPGHFPLFYLISAASQKLGLASYENWIAFWRIIFFGAYLGTALLIFLHLQKQNQPVLATLGAFLWLFNRWSLYVLRVAHVDFLAIFFLVLSVILLKKYRWGSMILFGVSLAIKQVAVFMAPLYIISAYQNKTKKRWRDTIFAILAIAIVPILSLSFFLFSNSGAVVKAVLFSVTRDSQSDFGAPALNQVLHAHGITSIMWLAIPMCLIYLLMWQKKISFAFASLTIFLVFLAFNTVLFNQYFVWFIPFVPLALAEYLPNNRTTPKRSHNG